MDRRPAGSVSVKLVAPPGAPRRAGPAAGQIRTGETRCTIRELQYGLDRRPARSVSGETSCTMPRAPIRAGPAAGPIRISAERRCTTPRAPIRAGPAAGRIRIWAKLVAPPGAPIRAGQYGLTPTIRDGPAAGPIRNCNSEICYHFGCLTNSLK